MSHVDRVGYTSVVRSGINGVEGERRIIERTVENAPDPNKRHNHKSWTKKRLILQEQVDDEWQDVEVIGAIEND